MKVLTFLGRGKYESVTYCWQEQQYITNLFPEAIAQIFKPEKVVVFVTGEVMATENFQELCRRLGESLCSVEIPQGRSEKELWKVFDKVVGKVDDGEQIILDITHALRSLPLVVFTVAAYLRKAKKVEIKHIVYGAFDVRDASGLVPVFDLTPALDLLEWLNGVETFQSRGDATVLAKRLEDTQRRVRKDPKSSDLPEQLQKVAGALCELSWALSLSRPLDVMRYANRLLPLLDKALEEIRSWSPPFAVVTQLVREEVQKLAFQNPEDLNLENLRCQLQLIRYYFEKGLIVQGVTLAREWLVSWVVLARGEQGSWLSREQREAAEKALGAALRRKQKESACPPEWYDALPSSEVLTEIWSSLAELRNSLAHCAMNEGASKPSIGKIRNRVKEIPEQLQSLLDGAPNRVIPGIRVHIDLGKLYENTAKLGELSNYLEQAQALAGEGKDVVLTGQAPIWLYLAVAQALHGKARRLYYHSPVTGEILIFDHSVE